MFKNEYIAKVGFVKTLDRTCGPCGGMYASSERVACPKCNTALILPMTKGDNPRPYLMTEVHLYPQEQQRHKDEFARKCAASGGLPFEIRMVLWGRYDKDTQTTVPDKRVQYLVPKRLIHVMFNTRPVPRTFHSTKDNQEKLDFNFHAGDQMKFLDDPKQFEALTGQTTEQAAAEVGNTTTKTTPAASPETPPAQNNTAASKEPTNADIMSAIMGINNRVTALEGPATPTETTQGINPEDIPDTPPEDLDLNDNGLTTNVQAAAAADGAVDPFNVQ